MTSTSSSLIRERFDLSDRVAVITGGGGLLGRQHALALAEMGATTCLLDLYLESAENAAKDTQEQFGRPSVGLQVDITDETSITAAMDRILEQFGRVDILINNAANNPGVGADGLARPSRLEKYDLEDWNSDIAVGLTGAFLCSRVFGSHMASSGGGSIVNISSDLGLIAPDQRLYRQDGTDESEQPVKPVTYSVVKSGLIGLTRYLATYWASQGVRCNTLAPGGVEAGQDQAFLDRLHKLIPMERMAKADEYRAAIAFLASDASSYMNGATLSIDGGRTCW